ncbi:hypothetical protein I656_03112 [Geobacillus sp. WSUCF1]|nr:hypothetical protein I656_03112 [Geobacillus sp. WSUCF1]
MTALSPALGNWSKTAAPHLVSPLRTDDVMKKATRQRLFSSGETL